MSNETTGEIAAADIEAAGSALAATLWPGSAAEPVFAEPWEGRAFGLAFDLVRRSGLAWEDFRDRLIDALADAPERPYYESWVVALERLTTERVGVAGRDLDDARHESAWYRYHDHAHGDIEVLPFRAGSSGATLLSGVLGRTAMAAEQIELYRTTGATVVQGVRAFGPHASSMGDVVMDEAAWERLRHELDG